MRAWQPLKVPALILGGSGDTINLPERTTDPIYEHLGSAKKSRVVFESADHFIFYSDRRDIPWASDIPFFVGPDPVWDMARAHDITNHFVTAFLLSNPQVDAEATRGVATREREFSWNPI